MEIYNNYKNYKQYLPEYKKWRDEQELGRAQRNELLKQNPKMINQEDIKRGKVLLHAVDVMDEYSQANAEDMEVATEMAVGQVVGLTTFFGTLGGMALTGLPKIKSIINKYTAIKPSLGVVFALVPSVIGMLVGTAVSFPAIVFATKAQISASRKGRFEAMRKDLKNPAIFASLTEEQMKKAEDDAKNIELEDRDKKRLKQSGSMNPMDSFRTLKKLFKDDGKYKEQKQKFDKTLEENEKNFNKQLTEKQITDAKRDRQMLSDIVQKMDIASQDYAENTELVTNTLTILSFAGGGLIGWVSNKLLKLLKTNPLGKAAKCVPWAIGLALPLTVSVYAAKLQKQASRVGRFNVRQEMLNNPETLVYVDEKDYSKMTNIKQPEKAKKPNIFKFFFQMLKENKMYRNYRKTQGVEELKLHKAIEKLELTDDQIQKAKVLQMNIFKTFNKVDEKSQTYAESVEALGQILQQAASVFGSIAITGLTMRNLMKMMNNPEIFKKSTFTKVMVKMVAPIALLLLPLIGLEIWTTKSQKKASRVADMLALKEMSDLRHYADYSEKHKEQKSEPVQQVQNETNLLKRFKV